MNENPYAEVVFNLFLIKIINLSFNYIYFSKIFQSRLVSEKIDFITPEQAISKINNNILSSSVDSNSSVDSIILDCLKTVNLRILYLKNVNRYKTSNDVERYAFQLARIDPIENSSEIIDSKTGKWLVRFKSDIGKKKY